VFAFKLKEPFFFDTATIREEWSGSGAEGPQRARPPYDKTITASAGEATYVLNRS